MSRKASNDEKSLQFGNNIFLSGTRLGVTTVTSNRAVIVSACAWERVLLRSCLVIDFGENFLQRSFFVLYSFVFFKTAFFFLNREIVGPPFVVFFFGGGGGGFFRNSFLQNN